MGMVRRFAQVLSLVVLLVTVPVVAQSEDDLAAAPIEVDIRMTDYSFMVDGIEAGQALELQTGQPYQIHFTNETKLNVDHEVLLGRDAMLLSDGTSHLDYAEPMLQDVEVVLFGEGYLIGVPGLSEFELEPGQTITLEFTLPADKVGEWEIGCFEFLASDASEEAPSPTHYDAGMHLPVNVSEGA